MNDELTHYGIKGMKWGVRRYQNSNGSLTPAGKRRVAKEYKRTAKKVTRDLTKSRQKMYVDSYNKAADYMNGGGIDKFNATQRKKYGKNYAKRAGYVEDYEREFHKVLTRNLNKSLNDFYSNNANYKKSKDLVEKYNMTKWDDFAKSNEARVEEVRRAVEKNK